MERPVLLLNSSEEVLRVIDWRRAIRLFFQDKVVVPYTKTNTYNIESTQGNFRLPRVLRLVEYVHTPFKGSNPSRRNVFNRDRWTCQYCGSKSELTLDHVHPRSRGGDSSWTNLVAACKSCNGKKSNHTPKECGMPLIKKPFKPTVVQMHLARLDPKIIQEWKDWFPDHEIRRMRA